MIDRSAVTNPNTWSCKLWFAFARVCSLLLAFATLDHMLALVSVCLHLFAFARICLRPPFAATIWHASSKREAREFRTKLAEFCETLGDFQGKETQQKAPTSIKTICANTLRGCLCKLSSLFPLS